MRIKKNALFLMLLSSVGFSFMNACVKALERLPTWEVVFFRSSFGLFLLLPTVTRQLSERQFNKTWKKEAGFLFSRGFFGFASLVLYFYAIEHMPLSEAVLFNSSAPLFVLIFSRFFLKERLSRLSTLGLFIALTGVVLILRPASLFSSMTRGLTSDSIAVIAAAMSSVTAGVALVSMKAATKYVSSSAIVFSFALVASLFSAVPTVMYFVMPTLKEAVLLGFLGFFGVGAQYLMTRAYIQLPASVASPLGLATVVFSTVLGWFFWNEAVQSTMVYGGILVAIGIFCAYRFRPAGI